MVHWGYQSYNGPHQWASMFPEISAYCSQSPIDIHTDAAILDESVNGLVRNYGRCTDAVATNNGHSLEISCIDPTEMVIVGGPLGESVYEFKQFHLHWGAPGEFGSEHTVNGRQFDGEIHFVHWNATSFYCFEDAVNSGSPNALCVLGVFFQIDADASVINRPFRRLAFKAREVHGLNASSGFICPLNLGKLFPANSSYFVYNGSLTTPPCTECVQWIVYEQPISVKSKWIDAFRSLESSDSGLFIERNYRPVQPLGNRIVFKSTCFSEEIDQTDEEERSESNSISD
ncbi:hypothetical protein ACOME3_005254 [Neoechinorhynchus agilis]